MDDLDPNTSSGGPRRRVEPLQEITSNTNETEERCPDDQGGQIPSTSASKDNNKENKGFMKRILGGRHLKTSKSTTSCHVAPSGSKDGGNKSSKIQESSLTKTNQGHSATNPSRKALGLVPSNPRTRQQLSRSQLLPDPSPSSPSPSQTNSPRVVSKKSTTSNADAGLPPAPLRKNFVKANMLAAASTKVKSTVHLEVPKGGGNLGQGGKKLSGSCRSLNSEPGVSVTLSPASSSFRRGNVDQQRRTLHSFSSRQSIIGASATLGRNSGRSRNPKTKTVPVSQIEAPNRDRRKSKSPRPRISNGGNAMGVMLNFDQLPVLNQEDNSSSNTSGQVSRRSSFNGVDSEIVKSLKQKQEHFQLRIENLQTDVCDLRTSLDEAEKRNIDLENKNKFEMEDMKLKLDESKNEMKDYFLVMMETQRSEMRDEIRKLLSFKDGSPSSQSSSVNESNESKIKSFKQNKEKLFSKIHRLSARMSMQDLDMKDLQEVKSWNEKKLENELTRIQDTAKKTPGLDDSVFRIPDEATTKMTWTSKPGLLEQQLSQCGSVSEPDLSFSGMFDTDSGVISQKMMRLAPSMSTLEAFPPPSPALANNSAKQSDIVTSHDRA